jgi:hypothetical protein
MNYYYDDMTLLQGNKYRYNNANKKIMHEQLYAIQ